VHAGPRNMGYVDIYSQLLKLFEYIDWMCILNIKSDSSSHTVQNSDLRIKGCSATISGIQAG